MKIVDELKSKVKKVLNCAGDKLVDKGTSMMVDENAQGATIVTAVIGAVIAISFMANALPSAYSSWTGATAVNGTMEAASAGDKAIWDLGGLVMVGGALMVMVGMFFKS